MVEFFIILLIVLVVVTLIGHGIWVVCALIVGAITGAKRTATIVRDCPHCGKRQAVVAGQCSQCGATPFIRSASGLAPQDESLITTRRLEKLIARGAISREAFDNLQELIRADDLSPFATPSPMRGAADQAGPAQVFTPTGSDHDPTTTSTPDESLVSSPASTVDPATANEIIFSAEVVEDDLSPLPRLSHRTTAEPLPEPASHPLDRPESPPLAPRTSAPRRTLAALLQTFMDDKNIRWGEIISGLLIVVCAVGLVVSLWATLRDSIPYLPAMIFMIGTGTLHAAGHYTLRSWNLLSISRAVLIIATLLIPLNFLAAIALSSKADELLPWTDPTYLVAIIVGLAAYGAMTFFAGRAFLGADWWRLVAGVMGPCAGQLLINRLVSDSDSSTRVLSLAMIPVAGFLVATVSGLIRVRRGSPLTVRRAETLLLVLGIAAFALLAALALLVAKSDAIWTTLAQLSPALSLVAGAVLASGLLIHNRIHSVKFVTLKTTGTGLAIGGAFGLAGCIVLAWPNPELLIAVGTFSAFLLATMGFMARVPALHGFAVACGSLAWIVAYHYLAGAYIGPTRWGIGVVRSFLTGESAAALGGFAALLGGVAFVLARAKHERDAKSYLMGAAAVVTVSGLVAIVVGFAALPSSHISPPTLCVYAIALTIVAGVLGERRVAWMGCAILLVALVQAFAFIDYYHDVIGLGDLPLRRVVMFALLTHGVICLLVSACAGRLDSWSDTFDVASRRWTGLVQPFTESALVTSLMAAPSALLVAGFQFGLHTIYLAVIALTWLGVAMIRRWPGAFIVSHLTITLSLVSLVAALRQVDSWRDALHPMHIAVTLLVLSACCILAVIARRLCRSWPMVQQLIEVRDWPTVDRVTVGVLIAAMLGMVVAACVPGALRELGFGKFANALTMPAHHQVFEVWMWATWAAVTAAIGFNICERITRRSFESLLLACTTVPLLIAGPHASHIASLSAMRWSLSVFGLGVAICWFARGSILEFARRRSDWRGLQDPSTQQMSTIPPLLVAISALPLLIATTMTVVQVVSGISLGGPLADSMFSKMGAAWSYGTPLALVATTLLVIAVRDAKPSYALGGAFVFQYLASLACLLPLLTMGKPLGGIELVQLGQWNAVALGTYGLIRLALGKWIEPDGPPLDSPTIGPGPNQFESQELIGVRAQVALALAAVAFLALPAAYGIILSPEQIHATCQQLGHWSSFLALVLAVMGALWLHRGQADDKWVHVSCGAGVCLAALVAAATVPQNMAANWLSFHVLLAGWTLVVTAAVGQSWWPQSMSLAAPSDRTSASLKTVIGWGCAVGAIVVVLSVYAAVNDPTGPWWAFGATLAMALAAGVAALRVRSQPLAYASTLLLTVAATDAWLGLIDVSLAGPQETLRLAYGLILTMTFGAGFWLAVEVHSQQRNDQPFQPNSNWFPAHRCFAAMTLVGVLATAWIGAAIGALEREFSNRQPMDVSTLWGLAAIVASGALFVALVWDRRSRLAILSLYAWGLAALIMIIDAFQLQLDDMCLAIGISCSAYIALTGALWRRGANLAAIGMRLGVSDPVAGLRRTSSWLPPLTLLGGGFAMLIGLGIVLGHPDHPQRVLTAPIPLMIAIGLGCLAQSGRKQVFQFLALTMLGFSCVFLSWADIAPSVDGPSWLSRVIRLLIVCCAVSFAYTMIVARRRDLSTDWQMSLKRVGLSAAVSGLTVLVLILLLEAFLYLDNPTRGAPINDIQLVAVSVVMFGLVAALIAMAVLPGRDPLGLSERGRTGYVYAAQIAGGLLFAHIYVTRPQWFGQWHEFWPYIILLIAFAGAGVGELFQRTGTRVLADPLQRTGTFLPLVPAIGMWFVTSNSDYSFYLFGAGILYVGLSIGRKSLVSALAATVAGNAALWSLLENRGVEVLNQPQLWLIPPALSVLIAAEINRNRLPENTMTTLRYASMLVIYVSSTGEIFIRGIGEALWPPMVLMGLSLFGAMAGIVLQIRAFLYIGVTFVLLAMLSMVWHAARSIDHVWPWWAFGIGMGLCILVFFGYFEKNREKMTVLVEQLKAWKP